MKLYSNKKFLQLLNQVKNFDTYLDKEIDEHFTQSEKLKFKKCLQSQLYSILKYNIGNRQKSFAFTTPYLRQKGNS
tara:strand:+ start:212 stop:439 length:228 start_codon:yes stop_codon:yes gene_type:complete